jgi:hypothetical protein
VFIKSDLFDADTIARYGQRFQLLVEKHRGPIPIGDIPKWSRCYCRSEQRNSQRERHGREYPHRLLHELFPSASGAGRRKLCREFEVDGFLVATSLIARQQVLAH